MNILSSSTMIDTALVGILCIAWLLWELDHTAPKDNRRPSQSFLLVNTGLSAALSISFKYIASLPVESSVSYEAISGIYLYKALLEAIAAFILAGHCDLPTERYFVFGIILLPLLIPHLQPLWFVLGPSLTAWYILCDQMARALFESLSSIVWQYIV